VLAAVLTGGAAGVAGARLAGPEGVALPQSTAGPADGAGDLSDVAAKVQPSVVSIEASGPGGSGFVVDGRGHIVTNAHVVAGADQVTVLLADRRRLRASVVGADEGNDIAVLSVSETASPPPLTLGRSPDVRVGDPVLAVGTPFGMAGTVTSGIVVSLNREVRLGDRRLTALQTDATINPGNSGGPLVNTRGEVIGVNTAMATRGGGNVGIGFAIPVDRAADIAARIIRTN